MIDFRELFTRYPNITVSLANLALVGLWVWLYRAVFPYLGFRLQNAAKEMLPPE